MTNNIMMPDGVGKLDRALALAEAGHYVFPATVEWRTDGTKDVKPRVKWEMASSNTPEMIRTWWGQWPDAFPCVDCGKSGIVVVDCDTKHSVSGKDPCEIGCKNGLERWRSDSPKYDTPSGGLHYTYRSDELNPVGIDNTGKLDRHIDVRGIGGMVIAWGDIPPADTLPRVPEIVTHRVPHTIRPPVTAPPIGQPSIGQPTVVRAFTDADAISFCRPAMEALANASAGNINNSLNSAAIQLSHFIPTHWNEGTAREWLLAAHATARANNGQNPAGHEDEALRTIESGFSGGRDPWKATRVDATPIEEAGQGQFPQATVDMEAERAYLRMRANEQARERIRQERRLASAGSDLVDRMRSELLDSADLDLIPDAEPLIKGWLYMDSVARIIGGFGSGKTFLTLDMACKISTGLIPFGQTTPSWFGYPSKHGNVLYVVGEGVRGIKKRIRAWESYHGVKTAGKLKIFPRPVQMADDEFLALIEIAKEVNAVMIILDTQARMTVGIDENNATDSGLVVDRAERMRMETGACVTILHHTGWDSEHGRGSTAWPGALQSEILVKQKELPGGSKELHVKTTKQKDEDDGLEIALGMTKQIIPGSESDTSIVLTSHVERVGDSESPSSVDVWTPPEQGNHEDRFYRMLTMASYIWWVHGDNEGGITQTDAWNGMGKPCVKSTFNDRWKQLKGMGPDVVIETGKSLRIHSDFAAQWSLKRRPPVVIPPTATTESEK